MTRTHPRRRGYTLTELMFASTIGVLASVGLMSLTIYSSRVGRSIAIQQQAIRNGRAAIEGINQAVRPSNVPLRVRDGGGNAAASGNLVELAWPGEDLGKRTIRLVSDDGNLQTPWDNRLVYDPDTAQAGDEVVLARWVTPIPNQSIFTYNGANSSLAVRMRIGDSLDPAMTTVNDSRSGSGMQGVEIDVTVAPRN
ncbi:hypothetical protein LLG95_16395 [bacterium]|nr:hypothetical protein [bacterium]